MCIGKKPRNLGSGIVELLRLASRTTTMSYQDWLLLKRSKSDRRLLAILSHDFGNLHKNCGTFHRTLSRMVLIARHRLRISNSQETILILSDLLWLGVCRLSLRDRYIFHLPTSDSHAHCHINRHVLYQWPLSEPSKAQTPLTADAGYSSSSSRF